jgi:hypothetical protein
MGRKINVGCGGYRIKGFENVDTMYWPPLDDYPDLPIIIGDARTYDYSGAETVFLGHCLEHFVLDEARALLRRIKEQAPKADLVITVPAMERCGGSDVDWKVLMAMIGYAPDAPPGVGHRCWYRSSDLKREIHEAGYPNVIEWPECPWLVSHANWQVTFKATV